MSLISLTIVFLLLSTVMPVTDSCMSWMRSKHTQEEISTKTSTTTISERPIIIATIPVVPDSESNAMITKEKEFIEAKTGTSCDIGNSTQQPSLTNNSVKKTVIVMEGPLVKSTLHVSHEPCSKDFGRQFCLNGGECYIETTMNEKKARCKCKKQWSGERCMHKEPDEVLKENHYKSSLKKINSDDDDVLSSPPLYLAPIAPPVRDIRKETININGVPCPDDEKYKYFCGGVGRCFMILFSEIDFVIGCECDDPYYGLRCEEKRLDNHYGSGLISHNRSNGYNSVAGRKRRHITIDKMRKNKNRRFHAVV